MNKEIKINVPAGYCIDEENSTFECIKFKPIEKKRFIDNKDAIINGYWINNVSIINNLADVCSNSRYNTSDNYNVFATYKQAKSALAMARISQIMANDERFGGVVTDEEFKNTDIAQYSISRCNDGIFKGTNYYTYAFLAFHTQEQRDLFLEENEQLVKDYLMID